MLLHYPLMPNRIPLRDLVLFDLQVPLDGIRNAPLWMHVSWYLWFILVTWVWESDCQVILLAYGTEVRDFTLILSTSTFRAVRAAGWMWDVRISCFILLLYLV